MTDLEELTTPAIAVAWYAGGWVVTHTAVPAESRAAVSVALVCVGAGAVVIGARSMGISLRRTRCVAETGDESRCTRDAESVSGDLCWQHNRLHGVTVHPSARSRSVTDLERDEDVINEVEA